jgi:glucose-6-phosphate isomerase
MTVLFDKVDEGSVGEFIYLFEVTTSFAGKLFGINTYDQPAVELGKEATFALMGREGFDSLAKEIEPFCAADESFMV